MSKLTDKEFDQFLDKCYKELENKQALLFSDYDLGKYDEFWYDQTTESIQFKKAGKVESEFIIIPIGSWSSKSNSWMWAWANTSITDELKLKSIKLKELAEYTGLKIFDKEAFEADEYRAHELTSIAVHYLNALGMYIVPSNNLKSFLALVRLI
ncbi:MAG: hypothetical protein PHD15_00510 [Clostridia bacterium]|nr:hypothetical protein [Clostridia bacterium]MDD4386233.1 hypothetical protein [Clostridia bacterium]